MSSFVLLWCFAHYINFVQSNKPLITRYYLALLYSILSTIFSFINRYQNNKSLYQPHTNIQNKILEFSIGYYISNGISAIYYQKYIPSIYNLLQIISSIHNYYSNRNGGLGILQILLIETVNSFSYLTKLYPSNKLTYLYLVLFCIIRLLYMPYIYFRLKNNLSSTEIQHYNISRTLLFIFDVYRFSYKVHRLSMVTSIKYKE